MWGRNDTQPTIKGRTDWLGCATYRRSDLIKFPFYRNILLLVFSFSRNELSRISHNGWQRSDGPCSTGSPIHASDSWAELDTADTCSSWRVNCVQVVGSLFCSWHQTFGVCWSQCSCAGRRPLSRKEYSRNIRAVEMTSSPKTHLTTADQLSSSQISSASITLFLKCDRLK